MLHAKQKTERDGGTNLFLFHLGYFVLSSPAQTEKGLVAVYNYSYIVRACTLIGKLSGLLCLIQVNYNREIYVYLSVDSSNKVYKSNKLSNK